MNNSDIMDEEWLRDYLLSLREGDEVIINDRKQTWTVVERSWDDREAGYWRYRFAGHGTHYEGIIPPDGSVGSVTSDGGKDVLIKSVQPPDGEQPALVSDTSAEEWLADAGIDIQ